MEELEGSPYGSRAGIERPRRPLWLRLRQATTNRDLTLGLILFATFLFLNQAVFVLNLEDIDVWDEAWWIATRQVILDGLVPPVGASPLVSAFYALSSLPYLNSPFWLIQTASLGRLILVTLLWLSAYRIGRQLSPLAPAVILLGMLLVTPLATDILRFPSDPLYSALAGLALAEVLAFHFTKSLQHVWASSFFLGLASLARNDGLLLGLVLVPLLVVLAPKTRRLSTLVGSTAPLILLVGGVVLVHGVQSGSYSMGTLERTYGNFESGQQIVTSGTGQRNATIESRLKARRLFGTPEENRNSVLTAIRRNPSEYLRRVVGLARALPALYLDAYGKRFGAVILILATAGIIVLLRRKEFKVLTILAAFTLPILSGFVITLIRSGHLQLWWFTLYALAAIGLHAMGRDIGNGRSVALWSVVWGAVALYGVVDDKLAVYYGAAVMLGVTWVGFLNTRHRWLPTAAAFITIALAGGLIIRGAFPPPKVRHLGEAADERAVLYLRDQFPPGTIVAAGSPGVVAAAGMTPEVLADESVPVFDTSNEMLRWMHERRIQAVYVDASLLAESAQWELILSELGQGLETGLRDENGSPRVLLLTTP